jgi:hypothetical protein
LEGDLQIIAKAFSIINADFSKKYVFEGLFMRFRAVLSIILMVLFVPAICRAEWILLEGKPYENTYGTKYYFETKLSYAEGSSSQTPLVVFWGKVEFNGKNDPAYVKLMSAGGSPETAAIELKYRVDISGKKAATLYGVLYDARGRILSSDEFKKPVYTPIPPDSGAEIIWLKIREMHEKGAISK